MNWLSSFMHPEKGYEAGLGELNKYFNQSNNFYDQAKSFQQPFTQIGLSQSGNLSDIINNLLNPEALQSKWTQSYQESPQAIQAEKMAQERGLNAANSMGLGGSNTALNAIQKETSQIGLNDRKNYLDDLMDKYFKGAGFVKDVYGTGANSANALSQGAIAQALNASNMGSSTADLAYGRENSGGNTLAGLIGPGIGAIGSILGGAIGGGVSKLWDLIGGKH